MSDLYFLGFSLELATDVQLFLAYHVQTVEGCKQSAWLDRGGSFRKGGGLGAGGPCSGIASQPSQGDLLRHGTVSFHGIIPEMASALRLLIF